MAFLSLTSILLLKKNLLNRIRKERVIKGDCLMFYSLVNSKFKFIFWGMLKGGIYYKYGKSGYFHEMYMYLQLCPILVTFFSANLERSNLYLKLFKLVFGSVSLFANENEQMLKVQ